MEPHESTRQQAESSQSKGHEDRIAREGFTSMTLYNVVHKFIIVPQAMNTPDAKSAVDTVWRKLETTHARNSEKVKSKKEVIPQAQRDKKKHFAQPMDTCHLKKRGARPLEIQKYKGRVVLRGDIVKDDSGAYAVFTEQGSSASQTTAAKVMDFKSRLPGCAGQAADAVSAFSQVNMEDAPRLLKIPKSECPDVWIRLPRHKWPKSWGKMKIPWYFFNESCTVIH